MLNLNLLNLFYQHVRPVPRKRTSLKKSKPKITLLGSSIARDSGPIIAANSSNKDTCVYSVSGLSLDKASVIAKDIFNNHTKDKIAVSQIGTADLYNKTDVELADSYDTLLANITDISSDVKIAVTSIPCRLPDHFNVPLNKKTDHLNSYLQTKCPSHNQLMFIDAIPELTYRYYMEDGLHFNRYATSYLARYLCQYNSHVSNFPV